MIERSRMPHENFPAARPTPISVGNLVGHSGPIKKLGVLDQLMQHQWLVQTMEPEHDSNHLLIGVKEASLPKKQAVVSRFRQKKRMDLTEEEQKAHRAETSKCCHLKKCTLEEELVTCESFPCQKKVDKTGWTEEQHEAQPKSRNNGARRNAPLNKTRCRD